MANNWAIVVGINHYKFLPNAALKCAGYDALAMRSFLCDEAGFNPRQVLLCGDSGEESSRDGMLATLRDILRHDIQRAARADNLWFFFSGHGIDDCLMPFDGNPRDLRATAIPISFVTEQLRKCKAKNIVIVLDMCRNESFDPEQRSEVSIEDSLRNLVKARDGQQGIITLFSCSRGERSYEIADLKQGAFTYALLEGLRRSRILKDLEGYLASRVPELHQLYAADKRRKQVPLVIPEPGWKYEESILGNVETEVDIAKLKERAIDAESDGDLGLAQHLWERVNLLATTPEDRRRALTRITALAQRTKPVSMPVNPEPVKPRIQSEPQLSSITLPTFKFQYATIDDKLNILKHDGTAHYHHEMINGVSLDLVQIPGGSFDMGSNEFDREKPIHRVTVPEFLMGKYPVTQAQWKAVAQLKHQKRELKPDPSHFKGADRPVESITWDEAVEFCDRLSAHTKRDYRLPSEAEWEYACRAGTTTPFHFGKTIDASIANYDATKTYGKGRKGTYRTQTTSVGSFPANAWGLFDCHGNVWEWCSDLWHDSYTNAPTDESPWLKDGNAEYKIVRGGSWIGNPVLCRSAGRGYLTRAYLNCGFRLSSSSFVRVSRSPLG
jgi:formylglycine-generating enzyme required for sulfatase activity/uncharacterized caspase-like protein